MQVVARCVAVVTLLLGATGPVAPVPAQGQLRFQSGNRFDLDIGDDAGVQSFALSDVNKDNLPDIVAVAVNGDGDDALAVLLSRGDGTFDSPRFFVDEAEDAILAPAAVAVADVGSLGGAGPDGNTDVIIVDQTDGVVVAFGAGTGDFSFHKELGRFPIDAPDELVGVAVADFDGQNGPDLAVLDAEGVVFFLCNTGFSAFGICSTDTLTTGGTSAVAIAVGKFNDDEAPDVVVLNQENTSGDEPGRIALFLGAGDGNFSAAIPATLPLAQPRANDLAVGLVNDDELNDVVVVFNEPLGGDSVQVFLGQASGRLGDAGVSLGLAMSPLAVAFADFDGDGIEDLVMPQEDEPFPGIVRGDGSPTFPNLEQPVSLGAARAVAVGDINADGRQDFVVLLLNGTQLRAAINAGAGPTFTPAPAGTPTPTPVVTTVVPTISLGSCEFRLGIMGPTPVPGRAEPIAVVAGDFDRDGNPDIAALDTATDRVVVLLTDPTLLRSRTEECAIRDEDIDSYALDGDPAAIAVGDLNRDARPDLVVVGSNGVTVFLADPTREGSFVPQTPLAIESNPRSVTIDDFNRDAILDIATANFGAGSVTIRHGVGDGTFPAGASVTVTVSVPSAVLALDLNGDTRPDLAVASETNNRVSFFFQSSSGTFSLPTVVSLDGAPTALAAANLVPGGGRELLVAVRRSDGRGTLVSLKHSAGSVVNTLGTLDTGPRPSAVGSADLNQEGNPADAVVASSINDNLTFYFANANGSFAAPPEPVQVGREPVALAIADFDADGKADIVVANRAAGTLALLRSAVPPLTPTPTVTPTLGSPTVSPTPTETPIPDDTPVPTRGPTSTPKEGTFTLSGGGCAVVGATGDDRGLALLLLGVAWFRARRKTGSTHPSG